MFVPPSAFAEGLLKFLQALAQVLFAIHKSEMNNWPQQSKAMTLTVWNLNWMFQHNLSTYFAAFELRLMLFQKEERQEEEEGF